MSRKNDDDIAVYDPYVQSLRRSQVDALKKFLDHVFTLREGEQPCSHTDEMSKEERLSLTEVMDRIGCGPFAEEKEAEEDEYSHLEGCTST